jgi:hypothetical protein
MTAAGIGAMFIPGGQAFAVPLITAGAGQMMGPGGALGQGTQTPQTAQAANPPTATPTGAPPMPEMATVAGGGMGFPAGGGGGDQGSQIASNIMANNPFGGTAIA